MNILPEFPQEIKILGREIAIIATKMDPPAEDGMQDYAYWDNVSSTICFNEEISNSSYSGWVTFYHEILHAINDTAQLEHELSEKDVDRLAIALFSLLSENGHKIIPLAPPS